MSAFPNPELLTRFADSLHCARESSQAILQLTLEYPSLSIQEAYEVQRLCLEKDRANGTISGFKIGLTSLAKQRDVNVFEPICGYLTAQMEIKNQLLNTAHLIHPRVEPEIAVILKKNVEGAKNERDLIPLISFMGLAIEVLDSRFKDFTFRVSDVIADNTSASGYVVGSENLLPRLDDVRLLGVLLKKNGEIIETGAPAAVLGHPLTALLHLVKVLEKLETPLKAGHLILTGGITASVSVQPKDQIEVMTEGSKIFLNVV